MKVLEFHAPWCAPCKTLSQTLASMNLTTPIEEIDIDEQPDIAAKYNIRGVPTMILLDANGLEIERLVGSKSRNELEKFVS